MVKTKSTVQIAVVSAILIALFAGLGLGFCLYGFGIKWYYLYAGAISLALFSLSFIVFHYTIENYFFEHIRNIYRNVLLLNVSTHSLPAKNISNDKLIPEINRILIDWEKGNQEEIVHLKQLEEFRKEFLGNVSHELKTPIFTIQGYVHTLLEGGIEDHEINILYLQKAARSIDRLISIVDDLESISKLEAGELILELRTFDISDLIRDVIESLELRAKENNVSISLEEEKGSRYYVYADKERIRQVLVNLLVNSIKYGTKNGKTVVRIHDEGKMITVSVSDNGIGIDKQHLPRLFERFYRVDKSRSREQGGTGLGLAIVKHIIEAHHQTIAVDSAPGEGTIFTFTLPLSNS